MYVYRYVFTILQKYLYGHGLLEHFDSHPMQKTLLHENPDLSNQGCRGRDHMVVVTGAIVVVIIW